MDVSNLTYLVGALRDGSVFYERSSRNYKVLWYEKNQKWLLDSIVPRVEAVFLKRPKLNEYKPGHHRVLLSSKMAHDLIKDQYGFVSPQENWNTPEVIKKASDDIIASYVAGYFDAEGDLNTKDYVIGMSQKNKESLSFIKSWLNKKEIKTSKIFVADKKSGTHRFYITSKNNFHNFFSIVKFEHPDKIKRMKLLLQLT